MNDRVLGALILLIALMPLWELIRGFRVREMRTWTRPPLIAQALDQPVRFRIFAGVNVFIIGVILWAGSHLMFVA
jgi:hypothetical protein